MCGRFFCLFNTKEELLSVVKDELGIEKIDADGLQYTGPRYNVCPSTEIPVLTSESTLKQFNWGFHAGKIFIINARNEEVTHKPSFKNLVNKERCVVICSGYYEWHSSTRDRSTKSPYSFKPQNRSVCYLAALKNPKNNSVVLMTREALPSIHHIHNRMPCVLSKDLVIKWLDNKFTFDELQNEITSNDLKIESCALAKYVNSITNTGPERLQSAKDYRDESFSKGIGKFFKKAKLSNEK